MRHKRFGLVLSAVATVALIGACDPATESNNAGTPASQPAAAPTEVASTAPTVDEATKKACTELIASIEENTKKVAEAEKIGPPAGHFAVGAQYLAGAADVYAKSIGSGPAVTDAASQVADEMDKLDKAWQKEPNKKPSKVALTEAIADLRSACGED